MCFYRYASRSGARFSRAASSVFIQEAPERENPSPERENPGPERENLTPERENLAAERENS